MRLCITFELTVDAWFESLKAYLARSPVSTREESDG